MSEVVSYIREGAISVITVNYPPVNALGHAVRNGLLEALKQGQTNNDVRALLLVCDGRTFVAGADIREFGKPRQEPGLAAVVDAFENSKSPLWPPFTAPP
jgi:3-hydroxyacyl-CoA dehydrogenase